jgi:serine/threonine protein kinase
MHVSLFVLIMVGAIPDLANSPIGKPYLSTAQVVTLELVVIGFFAAAVLAGRVVDARTATLMREAEAVIRRAAAAEAQLASARAELAAVLDQERSGIFSGLRIGDYQLGRLLGRGGMGEVYEATARTGGARIALKLMRGDRVAQPDNLALFVEEADALGRIRSPYVARVLAVGGIEAELPYLAMEYIAGSTLADILRDRQRLSFEEAAALIRDVARGLADVHAAGVLHLDLKPQNVIRTDGRWKLVDFGVARLAGADHRKWVLGTPSYMAPEQAVGDPVDARSDLYSLSAIAYRVLTGRTPYAGKTPA